MPTPEAHKIVERITGLCAEDAKWFAEAIDALCEARVREERAAIRLLLEEWCAESDYGHEGAWWMRCRLDERENVK